MTRFHQRGPHVGPPLLLSAVCALAALVPAHPAAAQQVPVALGDEYADSGPPAAPAAAATPESPARPLLPM